LAQRLRYEAPGPAEKVTIAYSATTDAGLAAVAQSQNYYHEEGLEEVPHMHPYGKLALKELLEGKADFATVAETPVMFAIIKGEKISIIATIQTSHKVNAIIARKDTGILKPGDLKGRKIAATSGTTSDFFLDAILTTHGISKKDVKILDLKAEEIPAALANGEVEAVSTFSTYINLAQKALGGQDITFYDENIYTSTFNVVAKQEFIHKNPGKVDKMLRALIRAEEFVRQNPDEAQKIVAVSVEWTWPLSAIYGPISTSACRLISRCFLRLKMKHAGDKRRDDKQPRPQYLDLYTSTAWHQ
jgi:NitT/TauT family transport system substrate-binding protein